VESEVGVSGAISSAADPTQCWDLAEEHALCDGPCVVLAPCLMAQVVWTAFAAADGAAGVFFVASDFNASRNDDGWCLQQNRDTFEIQLAPGCNATNGEPWITVSSSGGVALQDTWRTSSPNECICASTPAPSPAPLPPPIRTCECSPDADQDPVQGWLLPELDTVGSVYSLSNGTCWTVLGWGGGTCDGGCVSLGDCEGPNSTQFYRGVAAENASSSFFSIAAAPSWFNDPSFENTTLCVQENHDGR